MNILSRFMAILLLLNLQACGVGTQSLLEPLKTAGFTVGPATSKAIEKAEQAEQASANAKMRVLDIVVPTFDPNLNDLSKSESANWIELRRAEANLFAVELKKALERTEEFGAVRVTPDQTATAPIYVMGRIAESDGANVEIDIALVSITGQDMIAENSGFSLSLTKPKPKMHGVFKTKSFAHNVDDDYFKSVRNKGKNPYAPVFEEVAAFVVKVLEKYDVQKIDNLTKLTDMRFAASFSEDAFSEHMEVKDGLVKLISLPNDDDLMLQKVRSIRVRDQMFIDELQNDYEQFAAKITPSYILWQEQTLIEMVARRKARADAATAAVGAAVMLGLAVAAGSSAYDTNYDAVGDTMAATAMVTTGMIGAELIGKSLKSAEEAKMHNDIINELGESVELEVAPKVVAFEEKEKKLVGDAKEQFAQWRAFLKTIYELEKTPAKAL